MTARSDPEPERLREPGATEIRDDASADGPGFHYDDEGYVRGLRGWGILPGRLVWRWREMPPFPPRFMPRGKGSRGGLQYLRRRGYYPSGLPTLDESRFRFTAPRKSADEIRFLLYGEAMSSWRALTDVRFRLMNLLPAISIVAIIPLVALVGDRGYLLPAGGIALALLGLTLTHGLHIYDTRNDQLYGDLISRARRIEYELGVETGIMRGRLEATHPRVSHGRATKWVFASIKAAWCLVAVVLAIRLASNIADAGGEPAPLPVQPVEIVEVDS